MKPIQYTVTIQKPDSGDISEGSSGKDYAFTLEWPEGLSRPEGLLTLTGTDDGDNQCNITCGGETFVIIGCADGVTVSEVATTDNGLTFILTAPVATESGPDSRSEYEVPITVYADTFTRTAEFTSGAVTLSTTNSEGKLISASVEVTAEQSGLPGGEEGYTVVPVPGETTSIEKTVGWADGNDEAGKRPNGWTLDPNGEDALSGALVPTLYFTIDGVTYPLTEENLPRVGLTGWPVITVNPSQIVISDLPSRIEERSEYGTGKTYDVTWSLEPPAVPDGYAFVEVTEENKNNYSSVDGTLGWYYMLHDEFTFRVEAKMGVDNSLSSEEVRAILRNFEFKWSYGADATGERSIEDLIENGLAEGKFDSIENEVTISGLWKYNLDGSPIEYSVAAMEDVTDDQLAAEELGDSAKSLLPDEEEDYLQVLYSNSGVPNHPSDTDAVYNGGTLQLILSGETTFHAEKIWLDEKPNEGLNSRPNVTFTLYRYRLSEGYGTAAQVEVLPSADYGKDNNPIPKDSGEAGDEENPDNPGNSGEGTTEPEVEYYYYEISGGENLPKYDADGYPYVYGVREQMEYETGDNRYETVYGVVGENDEVLPGSDKVPYEGERASSDELIYNGGVVTNRLEESVSVPVTKTWEAAAYQSEFTDVAVELTLQSKLVDEDEWTNVTEDGADVTHYLHRFSEVSLSESYTANWPQYDGQGQELEYRWVETAVYQGIDGTKDETVAAQIAEASEADDATRRKIPVENNSFTLTQDGTSVAYVSEVSNDGETITNRIQDEITYDVIKKWKEGTSPKGITINIYQYLNSIDLTSVYVSFSFDATGSLITDEGQLTLPNEDGVEVSVRQKTDENGNSIPWQVEITGLPRFDEGGHPYSYALLEEEGFPTYETTRGQDGSYTTIVTNGSGSEPIPILIQKVWLDDGDDLHREPVTFTIYNRNTDQPLQKDGKNYTVTLGGSDAPGVWYKVEYVPKDELLEGDKEKSDGVYDIDDLYVVETLVGDDAVEHHLQGEDSNETYTFDDLYLTDEETSGDSNTIFEVTTDHHRYQVTYSMNPTEDAGGQEVGGVDGTFTITNRRLGNIDLTVNKTWVHGDGEDAGDAIQRFQDALTDIYNNSVDGEGDPTKTRLVLAFRLKFADESLSTDNNYVITYKGVDKTDTVQVGGTGSETVNILGPEDQDGNQDQVSSLQTILGLTFGNNGGVTGIVENDAAYFYNLPKYDADGAVVGYTVDEVWVDMTDSDDPKVVENLASKYSDLYEIWSEYNASFETEYAANDNQTDGPNTHDSQKVQVTNTRGETTTVTWHKQWQDAYANQNHLRPDLYLDIYRVVHVPAEDGGETAPPAAATDPTTPGG